jgi:hypothetical protein
MKTKINIFKDRVLISAILFSAIWHTFWLSAFTVIVVPKVEKTVKFSNVSFLGPILEKGVLNVNVKAHERTSLENSYLTSIATQPALKEKRPLYDDHVLPPLDIISCGNDERLTALAVDKIDTDKIEPGREMDKK